jgi:hypothetical protein
MNLGFHVHHVEGMSDEQALDLFQMPKYEIIDIIQNFNL